MALRPPIMMQNKGREKLWRKFIAGLEVYLGHADIEKMLQSREPENVRVLKEQVTARMEAQQ